jgi:hypothetical protein
MQFDDFGVDVTVGNVVTGRLAGIDSEGRILFRENGFTGAAIPVVIGMSVPDGTLVNAARLEQRALVMRAGSDTEPPVLVGILRERVSAKARDAKPSQLEVAVDGEVLRLSADRRIELRCGKARLLLLETGRIVLSGTNVVTRSTGPNKIKGASISLN